LRAPDILKELTKIGMVAIAHKEYIERGSGGVESMLSGKKGAVIDVKSLFNSSRFGDVVSYWRL